MPLSNLDGFGVCLGKGSAAWQNACAAVNNLCRTLPDAAGRWDRFV
ncbi:MAG: hypothetical protein O2913_07380 [Chloroflexi bacterium]|nr:hypothetical protein [Chloroflexota bacterium]